MGGTGLYGRAVLDNFEIPRQYPECARSSKSEPTIWRRCTRSCAARPGGGQRMEPTNERRIVRALEVTLGGGRPFSSFGPGLRTYGPVRVIQVAFA